MKRENYFGLLFIVAAIALLWWLLRNKFLVHESVTTRILPEGFYSPRGTVSPDPATGLARFDSNTPETIPQQFAQGVKPLGTLSEGPTHNPKNILTAMCPAGCEKFLDVATGKWWCIPT